MGHQNIFFGHFLSNFFIGNIFGSCNLKTKGHYHQIFGLITCNVLNIFLEKRGKRKRVGQYLHTCRKNISTFFALFCVACLSVSVIILFFIYFIFCLFLPGSDRLLIAANLEIEKD